MTFQGISEEENYNVIEYKTETKYGYDFMLIVLQYIIDTDFKTHLQRVAIVEDIANGINIEKTNDIKKNNNIIKKCKFAKKECDAIVVYGISRVMNCAVQFEFYNKTNLVRLVFPNKVFFKRHDEHSFDTYVNLLEMIGKESNKEFIELFKFCKEEPELFDKETRLLSISEIIKCKEELMIESNVIPIIDLYDNVFIAYDVLSKNFVRIDASDETVIRVIDSVKEYIEKLKIYYQNQ